MAQLRDALGVGQLALADRVGGLAQAGLVGRDLETDRVGASAAAQGVIELLDEVAARMESDGSP